MIRDPRDVVVSGYFYHLWTKENWANNSRLEFDGKSYQQYLKSVSVEEGLIAEIDECKFVFRQMQKWDYENPAIMEMKYEGLFLSPHDHFKNLFQHYGFHDTAICIAMQFADLSSFQSVTNRRPGIVREYSVTRSGVPGQWKEHFSKRVKQYFKEVTGDLLVTLDYEKDTSW